MKKLNCAVIGCGRIGCGFDDSYSKIVKTHAGAYYRNSQTNLIALCDIDKKKLEKYGKKYHISRTYTNSNELFRNEKLDCISICTLIDTHLDLVKNAAKNGVKGIFLEKPIAPSLKNAEEIINICKKNNIVLLIDHQRRFHPIYETVKKILKKKAIGDVQLVNVYYGAGISNTGSHMFDTLRMLFGEPKSIKAKKSKNFSNNKNDPNLDVVLEFESFYCNIHSLNYDNYAVFQAEIWGTLGMIKLEMINNRIEVFKVSTKKSAVYKNLEKIQIETKNSKYSPIQLGLENMMQSITSKTTPDSNGYDGYKALELIIGSIVASKNKKIIKLPLKNNNYQISSK